MFANLDASQLLDPGSWAAIVAALGFVLVGLAILMTLLDWGELSGLGPEAPPRRGRAKVLAIVGAVLIVLAALGAVVFA